jgi:hypothetical protein
VPLGVEGDPSGKPLVEKDQLSPDAARDLIKVVGRDDDAHLMDGMHAHEPGDEPGDDACLARGVARLHHDPVMLDYRVGDPLLTGPEILAEYVVDPADGVMT